MRISIFVLSALSAALLSTMNVQAADAPYYNPANSASSSGMTSGYELYKTIGCPGRGILEAPCAAPVEAKVAPVVKPAEKSVAMPIDSDGDGVVDAKDRCPGTTRGAKVDANGCELDADGDGVVDRLDRCPTTPAGRKVNAEGCELDGDGDGVVDALDRCPTTPAGRKVNAEGCELDGDGDGVVDALDRCPTTPAGRKVNAEGCELDGDGDGIVDAADDCPGTPAGTPVDDKGCTLPKTLTLEGVNFDNDEDVLRPDGIAILDGATATLKRYPGFKVEVAGHTDSRGSSVHNLDLSQRRAQAVMNYFIAHGIAADRLSAKGYGETRPTGNNYLEEGRMKNRRVELRTLD
ncbi:MAG: OmpA family protein [Pseudomonadota bacterium]|nr:OmpA family protein [Pseudomonadota bacterium]